MSLFYDTNENFVQLSWLFQMSKLRIHCSHDNETFRDTVKYCSTELWLDSCNKHVIRILSLSHAENEFGKKTVG